MKKLLKSLSTAGFNRLGRDERGVSAVEFAMVSPLFLLTLAFTVDFGSLMFARFALNDSVTAGANYAIVNADRVNSADAWELAKDIGQIIAGVSGNVAVEGEVVINNAMRVIISDYDPAQGWRGEPASSARVNPCYCPTGLADALEWGNSRECGAPCAGGGTAGRFVQLSVSRPYSPMMMSYGMLENGRVAVSTVVRVQ